MLTARWIPNYLKLSGVKGFSGCANDALKVRAMRHDFQTSQERYWVNERPERLESKKGGLFEPDCKFFKESSWCREE